MATFATPGTLSSRGRIVQYEIIDMSIWSTVSEVRPIFITRLVADSGWSITGGAAQVGSVGVIWASRSATSWRASSSFVPGLKSSTTCESWMTDFERIVSRPSMPASDCSSGTVTSCSTSSADRPMQIVWISTFGGANSGKTSTGMRLHLGSAEDHHRRGERDDDEAEAQAGGDDPAHHDRGLPPVTWARRGSVTAADADLGAVQLGRTRASRPACPVGGPCGQASDVAVDLVDRDLGALVRRAARR